MNRFLLDLAAISLGGGAVVLLLLLAARLTRGRYAARWRCTAWLLLSLRLAAGGQQNLNPALLIDAYCAQSGESVKTASIRRTALYDGAGAPFC